jgi:hypothetical protein
MLMSLLSCRGRPWVMLGMEVDIVVSRLVSGSVLYAIFVDAIEDSPQGYFTIDWETEVSRSWLNTGRLLNSGGSSAALFTFLLDVLLGNKP